MGTMDYTRQSSRLSCKLHEGRDKATIAVAHKKKRDEEEEKEEEDKKKIDVKTIFKGDGCDKNAAVLNRRRPWMHCGGCATASDDCHHKDGAPRVTLDAT